jgi:hypothetical protein
MRHPQRIASTTLTTLALLLTIAGCSRRMLTAPAPEPAPATTEIVAPPPPTAQLLGPILEAAGKLIDAAWRTITTKLVRVGEATTVTGARYELEFSPGSLSKDAVITIQDYDHEVLDVQLGPHGTKFGEPVVLSVDFSGTRSDPGAAHYDQSEPVVYWLNEQTNQWEEVPSTTDWQALKVRVRLEHFSRYVVGGKAGWKGQPNREQE